MPYAICHMPYAICHMHLPLCCPCLTQRDNNCPASGTKPLPCPGDCGTWYQLGPLRPLAPSMTRPSCHGLPPESPEKDWIGLGIWQGGQVARQWENGKVGNIIDNTQATDRLQVHLHSIQSTLAQGKFSVRQVKHSTRVAASLPHFLKHLSRPVRSPGLLPTPRTIVILIDSVQLPYIQQWGRQSGSCFVAAWCSSPKAHFHTMV